VEGLVCAVQLIFGRLLGGNATDRSRGSAGFAAAAYGKVSLAALSTGGKAGNAAISTPARRARIMAAALGPRAAEVVAKVATGFGAGATSTTVAAETEGGSA